MNNAFRPPGGYPAACPDETSRPNNSRKYSQRTALARSPLTRSVKTGHPRSNRQSLPKKQERLGSRSPKPSNPAAGDSLNTLGRHQILDPFRIHETIRPMTLPTPSSPSSAQPSAPDREDPHCPPIVPDSMSVAPESAGVIDDAQWTDIVLSSLSTRSREAREALLKALQNDQPARSVGSSSRMETDWSIGEPEVSRDAAVRNDQTQASSDASNGINRAQDHGDGSDDAETSPRTVPSILPLRSNGSQRASDKDPQNGECEMREGSMPLLAPSASKRFKLLDAVYRRGGARVRSGSLQLGAWSISSAISSYSA